MILKDKTYKDMLCPMMMGRPIFLGPDRELGYVPNDDIFCLGPRCMAWIHEHYEGQPNDDCDIWYCGLVKHP